MNYNHFEQFGSHFGHHPEIAAYLIFLVKLSSLTPPPNMAVITKITTVKWILNNYFNPLWAIWQAF